MFHNTRNTHRQSVFPPILAKGGYNMKGIALVKLWNTEGGWSIARGIPDDFQWYCGEAGWVSPYSSYWAMIPDCYNKVFDDIVAAKVFAIENGLLTYEECWPEDES